MIASSELLRERGFAEAKRLCYAGLDSPTLLREVSERLRRVVPFETYCAQSNDPLSGLLTYLGHDGVLGEKEVRTFSSTSTSRKSWTRNAGWYRVGLRWHYSQKSPEGSSSAPCDAGR